MAIFANRYGDFLLGIFYHKDRNHYSGRFLRFDSRIFARLNQVNHAVNWGLRALCALSVWAFVDKNYFNGVEFANLLFSVVFFSIGLLSILYLAVCPQLLKRDKVSLREVELTCMTTPTVETYRNCGNIFALLFLVQIFSGFLSFGKNPILLTFSAFIALIFYFACYYYFRIGKSTTDGAQSP